MRLAVHGPNRAIFLHAVNSNVAAGCLFAGIAVEAIINIPCTETAKYWQDVQVHLAAIAPCLLLACNQDTIAYKTPYGSSFIAAARAVMKSYESVVLHKAGLSPSK